MEIVKKRQKDSKKSNLIKMFEKVKNIKHIEVIIAISLIVAVIGIYFLSAKKTTVKTTEGNTLTQKNSDAYEEKLKAVLSEIDGAGKVDVMITYESSSEIITANTTTVSTDKTNSNDRTAESKNETVSPVLINQSGTTTPLIVKEILPSVKGVIVIAEGASDIKVRLNLVNAVCTALAVDADKVEIFTKNKA